MNEQKMTELVTICDWFKVLKHSSVMPDVFTVQGVAMDEVDKVFTITKSSVPSASPNGHKIRR